MEALGGAVSGAHRQPGVCTVSRAEGRTAAAVNCGAETAEATQAPTAQWNPQAFAAMLSLPQSPALVSCCMHG